MKQCIAELLGLQGWIIYQVKIESDRIDVYAGRPRKEATCPSCQALTRRVYDRSREWRPKLHTRCNGLPVYLWVRPRRFKCPNCGKVFTERFPGTRPRASRTERAEADWLENLKDRSFRRAAFALSIDEHSFRGQDMMITVTCVWPERRLIAILPDDRLKTNEAAQPVPGEPVQVTPFDPDKDARRVIAAYLEAVAAGDAGALQSYVWRYADTSAGQPLLQKNEVEGRLVTVESRGGFGAGGLWVDVYRAGMVPGGPLFFTLVWEPGDGTPRVAVVSREPVNIHARDAGLVEAGWQEGAEKAVRGYFEALERRDFKGAVRWVHPAWRDFTAMPEPELRDLRLLSTGFYGVRRVGRVVFMEYEVEAWPCSIRRRLGSGGLYASGRGRRSGSNCADHKGGLQVEVPVFENVIHTSLPAAARTKKDSHSQPSSALPFRPGKETWRRGRGKRGWVVAGAPGGRAVCHCFSTSAHLGQSTSGRWPLVPSLTKSYKKYPCVFFCCMLLYRRNWQITGEKEGGEVARVRKGR